jgi:hypothetical protein
MGKFIDMTGIEINRLTVIERVANKNKRVVWLCSCKCGAFVEIQANNLQSGNSKSCGCLQKETINKLNRVLKVTHGNSNSTCYLAWKNMKSRCTNQNLSNYKYYGERGISVCMEWEHSFQQFLNDMGEPPPYTSLERVDNNKGYDKENCKWATTLEQSRNKRNNHLLTYNGETHCITDWAGIINLPSPTLLRRLDRGLSIEEALTLPFNYRKKRNR